MARVIHAKRTKSGVRFRLWSTCSGAYATKVMTEEELREHMLREAIAEAVETHKREIDERIERAKTIGTSSQLGDKRDIDGRWDRKIR